MGCCASTTSKAASATHHTKGDSSSTKSNASRYSRENRASPQPAHPLLEEETVKEVLSETPTPKPTFSKIEHEPKKTALTPVLREIREEKEETIKNDPKKPTAVNTEEVSEVSEICSTLSESVSTATLTEKRDDEDGEVRQNWVVNRSPSRFRNRSFSGDFKRDKMTGRSPARRPHSSSPGAGRVKVVPGRGRRRLAADEQRKDPVECSGRRSRSPARSDGGGTRTGLSRNSSSRSSGKNTGRGESELRETTCKMEDGKQEKMGPPTTNESLENPLVSLECFIFF